MESIGLVDQQLADAQSTSDYFPFGSPLPGRGFDGGSYRWGFNGQEKDDEIAGDGDHLDFKFRGYDPRTGRFWSVDPLTSKFPWNSPYAFAENRVIDGIELEGLEVVLFDPKDQPWFYNAGVRDKKASPNIIDIYAHGGPDGIVDDSKGIDNRIQLKTGKQFDNLLKQKEEKWRNRKSGTVMVIVLHSCETGKTTVDEKGSSIPSVAQDISASKEFKDVYIVAPNAGDDFGQKGEKGPILDENGNPGVWIIFKNGKKIGELKKETIPKLSGTQKVELTEILKDVIKYNK